jgi:glycosyltransferase involved in cell wall biosynthesis
MSDSLGEQPANRKLRIALCGARGIPSTYSGTEAFFVELAPRLAQRGHDVTVCCRSSLFKSKPPEYKGVRLLYLPSIETKNLSTPTHTLLCMFALVKRNVDVILVTNVANGFHCIIPRLFGTEVAINVDGVEWKRGKWGTLGKKYVYWNAKHIGKICPRGVITDAYEMRRIYLEEFGTPSACIAYGANIENSVDPEVLEQYGLKPFGYYLIASRLVPENNADLIVKAFEQSKSERVLAIAGDANYRSEFVDRLKQSTDPRVRFLGHIGNADHIRELHCNAYAYIHGHSMGGTNPALLKALGYGNCILALNTPFNAEVLREYGILFENDVADLRNKLQAIDSDCGIVERYRAKAPQRITEAYTWERITALYEEFFLRLAAGENPTLIHSTVRDLDSARISTAD